MDTMTKWPVQKQFNKCLIKVMKGNAVRKQSLHGKTAASVLLNLFISGNERCHTHVLVVVSAFLALAALLYLIHIPCSWVNVYFIYLFYILQTSPAAHIFQVRLHLPPCDIYLRIVLIKVFT